VIPASSYYAYFDVTGVSLGTATISATSPDAKAATPVLVRVSKPKLILSVPTSVTAGTNYSVTVLTGDSLGTYREVTSPLTVSLGSSLPAKVVFDSTPIQVDAGLYFAYSGVRFDSAGTYLVIASAPGYTSDTVSVIVGGAFVVIADDLFFPDTVTIKVGNYVTWFNAGVSNHTSTSDTGVWNSGTIPPGNNDQRLFNTVGTFPYHCTIHGLSMAGTVIVTP
jgi:plastocyanin